MHYAPVVFVAFPSIATRTQKYVRDFSSTVRIGAGWDSTANLSQLYGIRLTERVMCDHLELKLRTCNDQGYEEVKHWYVRVAAGKSESLSGALRALGKPRSRSKR
jgi:hypothetical protein